MALSETYTTKPPEDDRVAASAMLAKASKECAEGRFHRMHELIREAMVRLQETRKHGPHVRTKS